MQFYRLFIEYCSQGRRQKNFSGGPIEKLRSKNSTNKPPSTLSVHRSRVRSSRDAASRNRVKTEDFFGETTIFGKMPTFLENFRHVYAKNSVLRSPLALNHLCLLTSTSAEKNVSLCNQCYESSKNEQLSKFFTKRVLFSQNECLLKTHWRYHVLY